MAGPLLLVDGDSMLFRAFYALPDSIEGTDGRPVNALLGMANLVLREVEAHAPRAVVICFGQEAAAYRVELFGGYHADRPELPDKLADQFAAAPAFFGAFGWTVAGHDSLEADDLLGALARRESAAGGRALIMTGDRDLYQCAGERVSVLYVRTGREGAEVVDAAEVERRYGVPPRLVPDFIALRGDPADGIPGAKGIGEKTAAALLQRYGSLEATLDGALGEARASVRTALLDGRDRLIAFKEVATLRDIALDLPPDRETDYRGAARAAAELGMRRLAERLERVAGG
ncbi:MAG: 5'-3' exonuclease [Thermoleophilaceae bacterium]|nr:5'-3' exonuclease [Thermoleophilaceae bacterium]